MHEEPVYENIVCEPININLNKLKTIKLYLKNHISFAIAIPVTTIFVPLLVFLVVPVLSKHETEPRTTRAHVSTLRGMPWRLKYCDTLSLCPYRLESYISQVKSVISSIDSKDNVIKSVTLYNRQN